MTLLSILLFLVIIVGVSTIGLFMGASKSRILFSIPIAIVVIPIILGGILFIIKGPVQEGKILRNTRLGLLLNLICPPPDLYQPLCAAGLEPEKTEYTMSFSHKYPGNHALMVSSPNPRREDRIDYSDVSFTLSVFDGNNELLIPGPEEEMPFSGPDDYGAFMACYEVPKDLPIRKKLTAKVVVSGNLQNFLERRGHTILKIEKFSDE